MSNISLSIILRTTRIDEMVYFYTKLGFQFTKEQHDKSPVHYSVKLGEGILEIYPASKENIPTSYKEGGSVTQGFNVSNIEEVISKLNKEEIIKPASEYAQGKIASVKDPDGRIVYLFEKK